VRPQESLLSGTDAITRGTVEIGHRRGSLLVRVKDLRGYSWQRTFSAADRDAAMYYFWDAAHRLRDEARETIEF
jgi:hypothetical protein